ncbi:hypothetical protein A9Q89_10460 [Gammaproteobacteria bacterium 53_120_T64]|nr:hypothetical protein A9Q89_10460 [Gammaproteobacteria bacterium 53_120_T64]
MEKVLISACLLGKKVRYDGKTLAVIDTLLERWMTEGRVISVCPEVDAGMSTPRAAAEISAGDGNDVLAGSAKVVRQNGDEVSAYFKKGAQLALVLCQENAIKVVVLTEGSPSCGSSNIYDGSFTRQKITGVGVTVALLRQHGIQVFNQYQLLEAEQALEQIESRALARPTR